MNPHYDSRGRELYEPFQKFWEQHAGTLNARTASVLTRVAHREINDPHALESKLQEVISELRGAARKNWLACASVLAVFVSSGGDKVDFTERYGADARVQFLVAALSDVPFDPDADVYDEDIRALASLVQEAFELARGIVFLRFPSRDDYSQVLGHHLQMEALEDRFEMYGRHLTMLKSHLLDPMASEFEREFGWSIDDYWRVADAAAVDATEKQDALSPYFEDDPDWFHALSEKEVERFLNRGFANVAFHASSDLSRLSGVELSRVEALLDSLALPVDGSAVVASPVEAAPLRTHGVVPLPDGRYFIPLPHLWRQDLFRVLETKMSDKLRKRWFKARDDGVEQIVAQRLSEIFGQTNVLRSAQHVGAAEDGETDVIVNLGDDALLVECKAHSLTPAGRRGAPERIGKKTAEIVEKSQEQIRKGRAHLTNGGVLKPRHGPNTTIELGEAPLLLGLAVSFERIDPMFMSSALHESQAERVLVISLADFIALTELVDMPSAFLFYIIERTTLLARSELSAASELDYIGLFLERQDLSSIPGAGDSDVSIVLEGYGPSLNDVLAVAEESFERPDLLYPPQSVLAALSEAVNRGSRGWTRAAELTHRVDRGGWAPFRRMMRRSRRNGSPPRDWALHDGEMMIQTDLAGPTSRIDERSPLTLVMGSAAAALD